MTGTDLCNATLQDLGILAAGEVASADDADLFFIRANDWLDSLHLEGLTLYARARTTFSITANVQDYTIGAGATINCLRPVLSDLVAMAYINAAVTPPTEIPIRMIWDEAWQAIPQKSQTSTYPIAAYYNPTITSHFGTVSLYYIPTTSCTGVFYGPVGISELSALTDTILFPPGYRRWMRAKLAIEVAAAFGVTANPSMLKIATESEDRVKASNLRMHEMTPAYGVGRRIYNIWSDQ